jgi:Integrase core domain
MGIREVCITPRSPWQNPFVERLIGSIRRECLDHALILNEAHLRRLLRSYVAYYNRSRPHQALENNSPFPRAVQPPSRGWIRAFPRSAGFITVTSASPDRERVQPRPPRSRKPPDGGPPGSSQAAPSRIRRWVAPLIPSRQGRRRQLQRSTHRRGMRRVPMRFRTGTGGGEPVDVLGSWSTPPGSRRQDDRFEALEPY